MTRASSLICVNKTDDRNDGARGAIDRHQGDRPGAFLGRGKQGWSPAMDFGFSDREAHWRDRVKAFMAAHVYPAVET